jgi:ABC-type Co2+ transport system permease subunit
MGYRLVVDLIGWAGALVLLTAYALVSTRRLEGDARSYQLLNLFGGAFLIVNTLYYGAYPSSLVNLVWVAIAIITIGRSTRR